MSDRYPGGIITKSPATPTGPFATGTAPGIWTLEQQMQFNQQGIWPTAGLLPPFIEDVFSTFLRLSDGTNTQAIVNGINLSVYGGLVWSKPRVLAGENHILVDSARGVDKYLSSDLTSVQGTMGYPYVFNTNGFTSGNGNFWSNGVSLVDWTFRKQPKFFDIVTYTGTGSNTTIAHSLGSVPGSIIVKRTDTAAAWAVYHRSLANTQYLVLNTTAAAATGATWWNSTTPTSAVFSVGTDASVNASGGTYVAYIFAHDAGGFGLTGTDNVISCGSFTAGSSVDTTISLGYEPQWVLVKASSTTGNWRIIDSMRGIPTGTLGGADDATLSANLSDAENLQGVANLSSTGFAVNFGGGNQTYIYIAIRRGPMKVPTLGTSVYNAVTRTSTGVAVAMTGVGFPPDLCLIDARTGASRNQVFDRLRGRVGFFGTAVTNAESGPGTTAQDLISYDMDGASLGTDSFFNTNTGTYTYINWFFRRAPGFFDEVCYTGNTTNRTIEHNLTVAPEMMIVKARSGTSDWSVYAAPQGASARTKLNLSDAQQTGTFVWNYTAPTSSVFSLGTSAIVNDTGVTYVNYLFATCAGVSKVGSYTGNGTTQTIDCGFGAGGARFVLIKRTDAIGDWYVYDTARGMTVLTDPYLWLNSTATEVATLGSVTTVATGFALNSAIVAAINVNAGSYIFLAIS